MRALMFIAVAVSLSVPLSAESWPGRMGSCSAGGCGGGGGEEFVQYSAPPLEWKEDPFNGGQINLWQGVRQVGAYRLPNGPYSPYNGSYFEWPAPPPINLPTALIARLNAAAGLSSLPPAPKNDSSGKVFFGVDASKISPQESWSCSGKECNRDHVFAKVAAAGLTDDRHKGHISILSADSGKRDQVVEAIKTHPALTAIAVNWQVHSYDTSLKTSQVMLSDFQLEKDERFRKSGFVIYVQPPEGPDGTAQAFPLYSWPGPERFAQALRGVNPTRDPNRVPELSSARRQLPWAAVFAGCACVGLGCVWYQKGRSDADGQSE